MDTPLEFRGGTAGAAVPFAVFLAGVAWLAIAGAPDAEGLWPVLLLALTVGMALARSRRRYSESVLAGMSQPLAMVMVMAWLVAGVLGAILTESGFVKALVDTSSRAGLQGGSYVVASFLVCCVVSTATGTSLGTLLICAPLLYPAGGPLLASPPVLIGALIGGATFGDNVSPVSDTTIASATTQGAEMGAVVKSRLPYALPAALFAMVGAFVFGDAGSPPIPLAEQASAGSAVDGAGEAGNSLALVMATAPALVIFMLLRGAHLLEGLLLGSAYATVLALVFGFLSPSQLLTIDPDSYSAGGIIFDGMDKAVGVSIFTLLLLGLVGGLEASGLVDRLIDTAQRHARSAASAERWIFAAVSGAVLLTAHSTVAILAVGRFTKDTGERFGVGPLRRANLLDVTVCSFPFLVPFFIPAILAASLTSPDADSSMPRISALDVGLHNLHSWGLLAAVLISLAWRRERKPA